MYCCTKSMEQIMTTKMWKYQHKHSIDQVSVRPFRPEVQETRLNVVYAMSNYRQKLNK